MPLEAGGVNGQLSRGGLNALALAGKCIPWKLLPLPTWKAV
jgi:hypothetical protein